MAHIHHQLLILLGFAIGLGHSFASPSPKRILVTGANKGIGRAICERLLSDDPDVHVLLGARDKAKGDQTISEISSSIPGSADRLKCIQIDTSSDDSVQAAAEQVASGGPLYAICNNAGIWSDGFDNTLQVNYFGPRRVNDAFVPNLVHPGGRVVNIASASGPMFVLGCGVQDLKQKLANPKEFVSDISELDKIALGYSGMMDYGGDSYGVSKALLNAYTVLHAIQEPELIINSCSPGFIKTDLTIDAGLGASNPPSMGAFAPCELLLSSEFEAPRPTGRYYGSDAVRSPLDSYRGPGEPPYDGP